ncbi:Pentatricopeptide repeat-containing protein At4g20770 [Linum grandiflorum]
MQALRPRLTSLLQSCIEKRLDLSSGKVLHASILRSGLYADTFLSNRLIEFYSRCNTTSYARNLFDAMPSKNIYTWNAILSEYCRVGQLEDAFMVFDEMSERNAVSWNNLISALVRGGFERQALDVYFRMILEGFVPTHCTLASVLSACGTLLDIELGKRCHCLALKIGLELNKYVGNGLLCVYAKCGLLREATGLFKEIPEPSEVTFTVMMGGLAKSDRVAEALEMFKLMCRKGIRVDSVSLSSVLGVCAKETGQNDSKDGNIHGKQVHGLGIRLGFDTNLHLGNSLLDMYAKDGDMESAEKVFANLPGYSVVSWNIMIAGYGQKCQIEKAREFLQKMQNLGFEPDEVTCINMLAACAKSGDMVTAKQMFGNISCPGTSSWNAMLSGYLLIRNHDEILTLFREMQFRYVDCDRATYAIVITSCTAMGLLNAAMQVHAAWQKSSFRNDLYVASGLIALYSKCQKLEIAQCIFNNLPQLDIVCWNSIIAGYSINSLDKEAFVHFKRMQENGMSPNQFSYATVLSSCSKLFSSSQGRQLHSQIIKDGFINDVFVGSTLIGMYCKCGEVDESRQFFDMMPEKSIVTWNEMIHGCAQGGRGDEAVGIYREMIEVGEKPDGITFIAVLTACSHSGLVDAGLEIFDSMQQDHGVEPILDHYTCIIDALGRAGRFHEAEIIVNRMPYKDDPIIWEVLLSSCRVHDNVSLAKRAADELLRLDPRNSSPYVLLANMYTSLGRWDEAKAVREVMDDRHVTKDPGYSYVEKWDEFVNPG